MEEHYQRRQFFKYLFLLSTVGAGSVYSFRKNKGIHSLISVSSSEAKTIDNAVSKAKKIAVEEHFTTEKILNHLASRVKAGARYNMPLPYDAASHTQSFINEKRLKDMDEAGVDMQVISPVCFQDGLVDPSEAAALARVTNDELCEIVKKYPTRFAGLAGLACQDPDMAAEELERAVKQLGLKGAMIYSHIQGEYLDGARFRIIFETAEKLGVPIYLHPKEPSPDMIKPYMTYPALSGKIWGYAAEAGLHAMRIICSGLFDKCPNLNIILGHGGEGLPYWLWRMGSGAGLEEGGQEGESHPGMPPGQSSQIVLKKDIARYIRENFYVSTSGMFWEPVLQFLHSAMGPDRVLFAVDYPAESSIKAIKAIDSLNISKEDKEKIFYLNAKHLLKL